MNQYIAAAIAEMDKINVSRMEHPGPWALDPASCRFVAGFARALKAGRALEFGSGFSSLMIAREIAAQEENFLLSIDSSPRYSTMAREAIETSGCPAKVEFRVSPLRPSFYGPRLLLAHALPKGLLNAMGPFDLALIDAPHEGWDPESALYDIFPAMDIGGYVIVDDANLPGREAHWNAWRAALGEAADFIHLEGIGNGLLVIEKLEDDPPRYPFSGALRASAGALRDFARLLSADPDSR
jgi:predicted O-methyltransferase YrrM